MTANARTDPGGLSARNRLAQSLFRGLPERYDLLGAALSFGQDRRWRRTIVTRVATTRPTRVLDVATGTAGVALALADRVDGTVVGVDLSEPMLREGRRRIARRRRPRPVLTAGRAEQLPFPDASFDALTFSYLLRYVEDPVETLRELARVVNPGGVVAGFDFAVPSHPGWRIAWWCYTRIGLPVAGILGGRPWVRVGRFLGPSISDFERRLPPGRLVAAWADAGFTDVETRPMSLGGGRVIWGTVGGG